MNRQPDLQKVLDSLASGMTPAARDALEVGSAHPFTCRCDTCLEWWRQIGPEDGEDKEGNYGPFTRAEVLGSPAGADRDREARERQAELEERL